MFKTVLWSGQTWPHINLCQLGSVNRLVVLCLLGSFRQISGSEAFVFSVNTLEKCFCETCATAIRTPAKRERTGATAARSSLTSDLRWKQHSEECLEANRQVIFIHIVFFAISGGQSTQIKYLSKSTDTHNKYYSSKSKSTAFSILLEWKYKSTQFFMHLSKKVLIDRFILQFYIDYFI